MFMPVTTRDLPHAGLEIVKTQNAAIGKFLKSPRWSRRSRGRYVDRSGAGEHDETIVSLKPESAWRPGMSARSSSARWTPRRRCGRVEHLDPADHQSDQTC